MELREKHFIGTWSAYHKRKLTHRYTLNADGKFTQRFIVHNMLERIVAIVSNDWAGTWEYNKFRRGKVRPHISLRFNDIGMWYAPIITTWAARITFGLFPERRYIKRASEKKIVFEDGEIWVKFS
jgi:hypothetical protein